MKIAFVEDNFLLWQRGRAFEASGTTPMFMLTKWESTMDIYAAELQKLGHECVKFVPSLESGPIEYLKHSLGHTVARVPSSVGAYPLLIKLDWRFAAVSFTRRIRRDEFVRNAAVVHYHSLYSSFFLASTLLGDEVGRTVQYTGGALPKAFLTRKVGSFLLVRALKGVDTVILDDQDPESRSQSEFLREVAGLPPDRIRSLTTLIVDPAVFKVRSKKDVRMHLGIDERAKVIVVVSAVMEEPPAGDDLTKNPFLVVRLFSKLTEESPSTVQLHLLGGGAGLPALKQLVKHYNLESRVFFHGVVAHDQVAQYVSASDLVFVPYRFFELNYGTAVFEAFASGRPVCGFKRVPDGPVERPGGFLVDTDVGAGAKQIAERLQDETYLENKSAEGIELARPHLASKVATGLEAVFASANGKAP